MPKRVPASSADLRTGDSAFRPAPLLPPMLPAHASGSPTFPDEYETYLTSYRIYLQALNALREEFWAEAKAAQTVGRKSYQFVKRQGLSRVIYEKLYTVALRQADGSESYVTQYGDKEWLLQPLPNPDFLFPSRPDADVLLTTVSQQLEVGRGKLCVSEISRAVRSFDETQVRFGVEPRFDGPERARYGGPSPAQTESSPVDAPTPPEKVKELKRAKRRRQRAARRLRDLAAKKALTEAKVSVKEAEVRLAKAETSEIFQETRLDKAQNKRARRKVAAKQTLVSAQRPGPDTASSSGTATPTPRPPNRKQRRWAIYGPPGSRSVIS